MDKQPESWIVFTNDRDKAEQVISDIENSCGKEVEQRIVHFREIIMYFKDGTSLRWLHPSRNCRGYKCTKIWCEKGIDRKILDVVIYPMLMGRCENIIWI